jgi:glycosyltransferase involved in cell wall biosynthesis
MYPPHSLGGYEIVWKSAVAHLSEAGHDVRVLTTTFRLPDVVDEAEHAPICRDLDWYWRDGTWPRLSFRERLRIERRNARTFEWQRRDLQPEVICWWAMGGMSLSLIERSRRHGDSSAFVVCDDWLLYGPQVDAWLRATNRFRLLNAPIERLVGLPARIDIEDAGPWLFPSETVRKRALDGGWRLGDTTVCHQGINPALFRPAPPRDWQDRLLYVGRLDPRKGVDLAIRVLPELSDSTTLRVVGEGDRSYRSELRELAHTIGVADRVTFSAVPREELPAVYAAADALIFPVRWTEPWGLVPLEAMAVGTPVIATGRGGSGEYLEPGSNCLLFDPEAGPAALAKSVEALARDKTLRSRLREGGMQTSAKFGGDDFNLAVEDMIERAAR